MRTWTLLALVIASGCATDDIADDGTGTVGADGKADGASGQLAPTYALQLTSKMRTQDSRETDPAKRYTDLTLKARAQVKVTQSGSDITMAVKLCDVVLPEVNGYQPELDPDFVATVPAFTLDATIDEGDLVTETGALVLGANLAKPLTDSLPSATSSRLIDQDRDGKPGVSVEISGYGKIYAALRVKLAFSTPLSSMSGAADVALDQKLYGDSILFYDAVKSAADAAPYISVIQSSNRVAMKRDASSCSKVRSLFPQ